VSVHLDGIMVASIIRGRFNIEKALLDLQQILWNYLEFDAGKPVMKLRRRNGSSKTI
jgi:hypothetical protein